LLSNVLTVPGISSTTTYSFDLGTYDPLFNKYYVTDRTNKSIDVVDLNNGMAVTQFKPGFYGCAGTEFSAPLGAPYNGVRTDNIPIPGCASTTGAADPPTLVGGLARSGDVYPMLFIQNDQSGPDGVDVVDVTTGAFPGNYLYVGDVGNVFILNRATGALVKKLATLTPTLRADEGCYDPVDKIYAIATPGAANPYMTFIDATTQLIIAHVIMDQPVGTPSGGLEACVFDPVTGVAGAGFFYVNNDGSALNGRGEIDRIPAQAIINRKPGSAATQVQYTSLAPLPNQWALGACDPTGIALGPGTDIGAMCRQGTTGEMLTFQILNRNTGAPVTPLPPSATALNAGGGDQITYDAGSNNWFLATSRWTASGNSCKGGSPACPLTPMLTVVNGTSRTVTARIPSGNNSHSVFTGGGFAFSPFTNGPSATAGGVGFPNGGIAVFFTQ
jgi:hypothetical protein